MIQHAHILVVDDQLEQQIILRAMLRRAGCHCVDICASGQEALQLLEAQPEVDLVLLDCVMPDMSGIDVCHRIRKIEVHQDTPVIMVTSAQDVYLLDVAFAAGATDYIRKPCEHLEIMARVNSALNLKDEMKKRRASNRLLQQLLRRMVPLSFADELEQTGKVEPRYFKNLSVVFLDFVDFTKQSSACDSNELLGMLNGLFDSFDTIANHYKLERLKTVGDEYQAISVLHQQQFHKPLLAVAAVLDMLWLQKQWYEYRKQHGQIAWLGRAAINTGALHAGIVGIQRFQFDVWGSAINHVKRMCDIAHEGDVVISRDLIQMLPDVFYYEPYASVELKGEGKTELFVVKQTNTDALYQKVSQLLGEQHRHWHTQALPHLLNGILSHDGKPVWGGAVLEQL